MKEVLSHFLRLISDIQMLPDGNRASDETDEHTQNQAYRNQDDKHLVDRHQAVHEITDDGEPVQDVFHCLLVQEIQRSK